MAPSPVLIACDLGGTTHTVLEAGLWLADGLRAPVRLLHVDDYGHLLSERFHAVDPEALGSMRERYREGAIADLHRLVRQLGWEGGNVTVRVREGRAYEQIVEEAGECRPRLVVAGTRSRGDLSHVGVGHVPIRILRQASVPVMAVDVCRPWQGILRILYATDLEGEEHAAARWVARLAGILAAHVTIVHVSEIGARLTGPYVFPPPALEEHRTMQILGLEHVAREIRERAREEGAGASGVTTQVFISNHVSATILERAADERADLVVVGTHGRGPLARAMLGSVSEKVLQRATTSILVVPEASGR